MAAFLSQEWLDLQRELASSFPTRAGVSARLQHVVTGAPDGDVAYVTVVEEGKLVAATLGEDAAADTALATPYDEAVRIARGELDTNAAFMQGRVKVNGPMGPFMAVLPLTQSAEYQSFQAALAERTELSSAR